MTNTLNTATYFGDISLAGVVIYKQSDFKSNAEYQLNRMIVAQVVKMARKNPDLMDYAREILSQAYQVCKHNISYNPDMDIALAVVMVKNAVTDEIRKLTHCNRSSKLRLDSRRSDYESLDADVGKDGATSDGKYVARHELIADDKMESPSEYVDRWMRQTAVHKAMRKVLSEKEQKVMALAEKGHNFEEIGKLIGISGSYAGRLCRAALIKLGKVLGTQPDLSFTP